MVILNRANRTLIELLHVQSGQNHAWVENLPRAIMVHNSTYHSAIEQSPAAYLLEEKHSMGDAVPIGSNIEEIWRAGNPFFKSYCVGQQVLRKVVRRGRQTEDKFEQRFEGPYVIIKVNPNGITYELEHVVEGRLVRAHHGQLRSYMLPPRYLTEHPCFGWVAKSSTDEELVVENEPEHVEYRGAPSEDSVESSEDSTSVSEQRDYERSTRMTAMERASDREVRSSVVATPAGGNRRSYYNLGCMPSDLSVAEEDPCSQQGIPALTEVENHSGVIIQRDEVFWEMSSIGSEDYRDPVDQVKDRCAAILNAGIVSLQESLGVLELLLTSGTNSSFSGFGTQAEASPVLQMLNSIQGLVERLNERVSPCSTPVPVV